MEPKYHRIKYNSCKEGNEWRVADVRVDAYCVDVGAEADQALREGKVVAGAGGVQRSVPVTLARGRDVEPPLA